MSRAFFCFYLFLESRADEPSVFGRIGPADLREITRGAVPQPPVCLFRRGAPHSASSDIASRHCWKERRRFLLVFTNLSLSLLDALREGTAACGAPDVRLLCPSRSGASSSKMQVDAPALLRPRRPGAAPYSHGDSGCIVTSIRRFLCTMMLLPPFMLGFSIFTFGPLSVACSIDIVVANTLSFTCAISV